MRSQIVKNRPSEYVDTRPNTLKGSCIQFLLRHSLFQSDFSLDTIQTSGLTKSLLSEIDNKAMEPIESPSDMEKYSRKFIIFSVSLRVWGHRYYHLLYPEKNDVIVGLVSGFGWEGVKREPGFSVYLLTTQGEDATWTDHLTISKLEDLNFKCRLPSLTELDKIGEVINKQQRRFVGFDLSTEMVETQKTNYAKILTSNFQVPPGPFEGRVGYSGFHVF